MKLPAYAGILLLCLAYVSAQTPEPYCIAHEDKLEREYTSAISWVGSSVTFPVGDYVASGAGSGLIYESDVAPVIGVLELFGPASIYGCANKINSIWHYNWTSDRWSRYDFSSPFEWLNDLEYVISGETYSINANESCTLEHPNDGAFWKSELCETACEEGKCLPQEMAYCMAMETIHNRIYNYSVTYLGKAAELRPIWFGEAAGEGLMYLSDSVPEVEVEELFGPNSPYGCANKIDSVWWYNWSSDKFLSYKVGYPFLSDLHVIRTGEAYMVKVNESCTLEHPHDGEFWMSEGCDYGCRAGSCVKAESACGLADLPPYDNVIDLQELLITIESWKQGLISMPELIRAIGEWKNGCSS